MDAPISILFVCTGNSCRSQMAEGLARFLGGDAVDVYSAGTNPIGIAERTYEVMDEIGVDISGQVSEPLEMYIGQPFDYVITLCTAAEKACPVWKGSGKRIHWPVPDPYGVRGSEEQMLSAYRTARDMIADRVLGFFEEIGVPVPRDKAKRVKSG